MKITGLNINEVLKQNAAGTFDSSATKVKHKELRDFITEILNTNLTFDGYLTDEGIFKLTLKLQEAMDNEANQNFSKLNSYGRLLNKLAELIGFDTLAIVNNLKNNLLKPSEINSFLSKVANVRNDYANAIEIFRNASIYVTNILEEKRRVIIDELWKIHKTDEWGNSYIPRSRRDEAKKLDKSNIDYYETVKKFKNLAEIALNPHQLPNCIKHYTAIKNTYLTLLEQLESLNNKEFEKAHFYIKLIKNSYLQFEQSYSQMKIFKNENANFSNNNNTQTNLNILPSAPEFESKNDSNSNFQPIYFTNNKANISPSAQTLIVNKTKEEKLSRIDELLTGMNHQNFEDLPEKFKCPVSLEIMTRPVLADDQVCYDQKSAADMIASKVVSHKTGKPINHYLPNGPLENEIIEYLLEKKKILTSTKSSATVPADENNSISDKQVTSVLPNSIFNKIIDNTKSTIANTVKSAFTKVNNSYSITQINNLPEPPLETNSNNNTKKIQLA